MNHLFKSIALLFSFCLLFGSTSGQEVRIVKDINPNGNSMFSGNGAYLTSVGDKLFFVANDGEIGRELWITDGTREGTELIKDIYAGAEGSDIHGLIEHNGLCYFFADDGINGKELWSSDGSESGTQMVADINVGDGSAVFGTFEYLTSYNGSLYFEAFDDEDDLLWQVDSDNNASIVELPFDNFHSSITGIHVMEGDLYFFRKLTFDGLILYKYDGSQLTKIVELGLGNIITHQHSSNGIMYYAVQSGFDDILYVYDGNTDMNSELFTPESTVHSAIAYNSKLIFSVDDDPSLYVIDHVLNTPTVLNAAETIFIDKEPTAFSVFNNYIYYYGESSDDGIHRTDGTIPGTELLFDIKKPFGGTNAIHVFQNNLLIAGEKSYTTGEELFISDGEASLEILSDINPGNKDSEPNGFITLGDEKVFFTAETEDAGRELWVYDLGPVSTKDFDSESFEIYPTLADKMISVKNLTDINPQNIKAVIYNAEGIIVKEDNLDVLSSGIDVSQWNPGVYFIGLETGKVKQTFKFVKL